MFLLETTRSTTNEPGPSPFLVLQLGHSTIVPYIYVQAFKECDCSFTGNPGGPFDSGMNGCHMVRFARHWAAVTKCPFSGDIAHSMTYDYLLPSLTSSSMESLKILLGTYLKKSY